MRRPKVSVVVPTLNAGPGFGELLDRLAGQQGDFDLETVVLDSGSTDGTAETARRSGAAVYGVPVAEFDHGATRNLGAARSRGEYVAFLVQDALPLDGRWLAAMVENLEGDDRVAGVYGRQVPRPDAGALARVLVGAAATGGTRRREQSLEDPAGYGRLTPEERLRLSLFDNVSSCLRRTVWEEFPFEAEGFGEDLRWGRRVTAAGYKVVYEPRSAVVHSHERGALYDLRRHYVHQRLLSGLFGLEPGLGASLLGVPAAFVYLLTGLAREASSPGEFLRSLPPAAAHALVSRVGAYLGGRSRELARTNPRLFAALDGFLGRGV